MYHISTISLLLILIPPTSPTIAGLYLIGRDGINNTLNSAIEVPKNFLRGLNDEGDLASKELLDGATVAVDSLQRLMNFILKVVFTPLDLIIYPVDLVVEGILNMIPFVRRIAQLLDRLIYGFNDLQGQTGAYLSDASRRIGQKIGRPKSSVNNSTSRSSPTQAAVQSTVTVFIGNSSVQISDKEVLLLYNMFVGCGKSSLVTLPEVIRNAKLLEAPSEAIVEPAFNEARSNLSESLRYLAEITDSMRIPSARVTGAVELFRDDVQRLLRSLNSNETEATAKYVSRAITSSVLLLNDLSAAGVDAGELNDFYIQVVTGLITAVGAVSLEVTLSTGSPANVRSFLQIALKPLNINDTVSKVCQRIGR